MIKLAQFVFGIATLGAVVLFSACYLNPSIAGRTVARDETQAAYLTASIEFNSLLRDASSQAPSQMSGFSSTASGFVDRNMAEAKLQLLDMRSSIAANVSSLSWMRPDAATLQQAVQEANIDTHNLASKMPVVNALRSNMNHLSDLHPTLSAANVGF